MHWRDECACVDEAYRSWRGAECFERKLAFAAYRAALDREERAAREYRDSAERIAVEGP